VLSFGQTSPLRKGVGVKLKSFFYKYKRESEFTGEKGSLAVLSLMGVILVYWGLEGKEVR